MTAADLLVDGAFYPCGWLCGSALHVYCKPAGGWGKPLEPAGWAKFWVVLPSTGASGERTRSQKWLLPAAFPRWVLAASLPLWGIRQDQHVVLTQAFFQLLHLQLQDSENMRFHASFQNGVSGIPLALLNVSSSDFHRQTLWGTCLPGQNPMAWEAPCGAESLILQGGFLWLW